MGTNKKEPKAPSAKNDRLEDKNTKNSDKRPADQNAIGRNEFEEDRSTDIRMKPQPFKKEKQHVHDHESDGL
jgi:hypothetical protein